MLQRESRKKVKTRQMQLKTKIHVITAVTIVVDATFTAIIIAIITAEHVFKGVNYIRDLFFRSAYWHILPHVVAAQARKSDTMYCCCSSLPFYPTT